MGRKKPQRPTLNARLSLVEALSKGRRRYYVIFPSHLRSTSGRIRDDGDLAVLGGVADRDEEEGFLLITPNYLLIVDVDSPIQVIVGSYSHVTAADDERKRPTPSC